MYPSWLPDAIMVALLTIGGNIVLSIISRHKVASEKNNDDANTAKILVDASGEMVQRLVTRVDELSAELARSRLEYQSTINELQERVSLINRQYTDYILLTDDRIAELEKENQQFKEQNRELRKQITVFLESKADLAQ